MANEASGYAPAFFRIEAKRIALKMPPLCVCVCVCVCAFNCFHLRFVYTRRAHDTPCTAARPNVIVVAHSGRHLSATLAMTQTNHVHQYRTHSPVNTNIASLSLSCTDVAVWRKQNKLVLRIDSAVEWLRMVCHLLPDTYGFGASKFACCTQFDRFVIRFTHDVIQAPLRGADYYRVLRSPANRRNFAKLFLPHSIDRAGRAHCSRCENHVPNIDTAGRTRERMMNPSLELMRLQIAVPRPYTRGECHLAQ